MIQCPKCSPEILAERSRQFLKKLGYWDKSANSAYGFMTSNEHLCRYFGFIADCCIRRRGRYLSGPEKRAAGPGGSPQRDPTFAYGPGLVGFRLDYPNAWAFALPGLSLLLSLP